jgi:uncharacterized protein YqhQ
MMPILEGGEETLVGGQAVMEGVMMRAPHSYCVAVRKSDGEIVTGEKPLERLSEKHKIFKFPLIRGVATLCQAMKLGYDALRFSTNVAIEELAAKSPLTDVKSAAGKEMPGWAMTGNLLLSVAFLIFIYKYLPLLAVTKLAKVYPVLAGHWTNAGVDGIIRIAIFLAFLYGVSRLKDMHRMFQYHGAEHKVVFNYEAGQPVTVENAQRFTTYHPRCGTSFLMVLMFLAIPINALIPFDGFLPKLLCRIALLPVTIGLSYELIRFAAKRPGSILSVVTAPGLWLQRITTQPPANDQAEVAIRALDGAMTLEAAQGGELIIA